MSQLGLFGAVAPAASPMPASEWQEREERERREAIDRALEHAEAPSLLQLLPPLRKVRHVVCPDHVLGSMDAEEVPEGVDPLEAARGMARRDGTAVGAYRVGPSVNGGESWQRVGGVDASGKGGSP